MLKLDHRHVDVVTMNSNSANAVIWNEARLSVRVQIVLILLLSATVCGAQAGSVPPAGAEFTKELVGLISALQKNPWRGWSAGTEVTVRYIVDRDAAGKPLGKE